MAPAQACTYTDEAVFEPLDALVKRSSRIVLGDVVSLSIKGGVRAYTVKMVETIAERYADMVMTAREMPLGDVQRSLQQ